jgi:hypothetical protein
MSHQSTEPEMKTYRGHCHCGNVQFEVNATLDPVARCNCSFCSRRGAIMHKVPIDQFTLIAGEESLTLYQFHTQTAKHYFCKVCGIYPFHRPRTAPGFYGINVACLEGVDPFKLEPGLVDGRSYS